MAKSKKQNRVLCPVLVLALKEYIKQNEISTKRNTGETAYFMPCCWRTTWHLSHGVWINRSIQKKIALALGLKFVFDEFKNLVVTPYSADRPLDPLHPWADIYKANKLLYEALKGVKNA